MNDMRNDARVRHLARSDAYRLLSAGYYEPEDAFLEEEVFDQLKTAMSQVSADQLSDVVAMDDGFRNTGIDALMLDYTRLFLGPANILAKPYGSIYLEDEKTVMGDTTMRALALYREGGFEIADDFREVPDHVALELEFLHLLSFRLGHAEAEDERARFAALKRRFLTEHLGYWVGKLAQAMREGAETDFYKRLADVTERFVLEDLRENAGAD